MKKNILFLGIMTLILFQGCSKSEVKSYSEDNSLFFEWKDSNGSRIDTAAMSFSEFVGKTEYTHPFTVKLIGDLLKEDKEYKVTVVDSLTTAKKGQYSLPDKLIFRKNRSTDSLNVSVFKNKLSEGEEVVLTLRLINNENFKVGYQYYTDVKFRFNNKMVKPSWWTFTIEAVYFGNYSYEKFTAICEANPGFTSTQDISGTQIRKIAIKTKTYIKENHITEKDGSEMIIPIY